jgi:L-lactate dehydrogenase complex protein LldG
MNSLTFLNNIRSKLGNEEAQRSISRPPILMPRMAGGRNDELALLFNEIRKVSGEAEFFSTDHIGETLKNIVERYAIQKAVCWQTEWLEHMKVEEELRALSIDLISPFESKEVLAECELGVTEVDFALPETGTLVLRSDRKRPRMVSLLPRVHLAFLDPRNIRSDLHQVFAEAKADPYLVFITGPSRTADIELTVSLGVHGPKTLLLLSLP